MLNTHAYVCIWWTFVYGFPPKHTHFVTKIRKNGWKSAIFPESTQEFTPVPYPDRTVCAHIQSCACYFLWNIMFQKSFPRCYRVTFRLYRGATTIFRYICRFFHVFAIKNTQTKTASHCIQTVRTPPVLRCGGANYTKLVGTLIVYNIESPHGTLMIFPMIFRSTHVVL